MQQGTVTTRGAVGAPVMASAAYTHDRNANRASQVLSIGGMTETTTYKYDALDQLRSFSVLPGAGSPSSAEPRHTWYGHERYRRVYEGRCRGGALVSTDDDTQRSVKHVVQGHSPPCVPRYSQRKPDLLLIGRQGRGSREMPRRAADL